VFVVFVKTVKIFVIGVADVSSVLLVYIIPLLFLYAKLATDMLAHLELLGLWTLLQFLYMPAIATEIFFIYYNLSPQDVSAPTGHPEVEQNISRLSMVLFHLRMASRG
jgi:hypothetical protein